MVHFSTAFPGGNGVGFARISDDHYSFAVDLRGGERGLWFCFWVYGAEGRTLTFDVVNGSELLGWPDFGAMRPVYGFPGSYERITQAAQVFPEQGLIRFSVPCLEGGVVAFCYPYVRSDLEVFWRAYGESLPVRRRPIMTSSQGLPVEVWEAGGGTRGVWMTCRTHAGESPASYVLEGFLMGMADVTNDGLLNATTIRVCPMVDVDNVQTGGYGKYGPPSDPYMDWQTAPVSRPVAALQRYFRAARERPFLYIDLHSPEPCGSTYACTWTPSEVSAAYMDSIDRFCRTLYACTRDPLKLDLSRTKGYPQWFGDQIDCSSQGYFRSNYGCLSLTLEVSYHWTSSRAYPRESDYRAFGRALCRAVTQTCTDAQWSG
jgi:hypothetical protein